jgi:hypothetical protein
MKYMSLKINLLPMIGRIGQNTLIYLHLTNICFSIHMVPRQAHTYAGRVFFGKYGVQQDGVNEAAGMSQHSSTTEISHHK